MVSKHKGVFKFFAGVTVMWVATPTWAMNLEDKKEAGCVERIGKVIKQIDDFLIASKKKDIQKLKEIQKELNSGPLKNYIKQATYLVNSNNCMSINILKKQIIEKCPKLIQSHEKIFDQLDENGKFLLVKTTIKLCTKYLDIVDAELAGQSIQGDVGAQIAVGQWQGISLDVGPETESGIESDVHWNCSISLDIKTTKNQPLERRQLVIDLPY